MKKNIIFEAFQQAEGSTSRKYGVPDWDFISRGLAELLGGTIEPESAPSPGSTFTLFPPPNGGGTDQNGTSENLSAPSGPVD
jgi:hypothetical protein